MNDNVIQAPATIFLGAHRMSENSNERTQKILADHHSQIATFARESYKHDGRGVVQVSFPNVPPGRTGIAIRPMRYITLDQVQAITAKVRGGDDVANLIRMIETYEPERQAVVTAAIDNESPITIKMKLELPTFVEDPGQIQ